MKINVKIEWITYTFVIIFYIDKLYLYAALFCNLKIKIDYAIVHLTVKYTSTFLLTPNYLQCEVNILY